MFDLYKKFILDTINTINDISYPEISNFIQLLLEAYNNNNKILIAGNGGSAATASHFHEDLCFGSLTGVKNPKRFKLYCLTDSSAYITAIGNDIGYEDIFLYQLKNLYDKNDLFIGISCSGNSPNIVKCVEFGLEHQMNVFCLLGFEGGKIAQLTNNYILVKDKYFSSKERVHNFGIIEGVHSLILHYVVYEINKKLKGEVL